jgi:hypothetical protein
MAPSQAHPDWDSLNTSSYQTIDLTLSSPEPEPEPRRRPPPRPQPRPPQRQAQLYFGREPRPYGMSNVKMEASRSVNSAQNPVAPQPARPINPEHIKQIIDTADPRALRRVLLELCQVSPAFSGALVRGLAPHSTSAQDMISQNRMRSQQPKVKTQDDEESDDIYQETKMKLARSVHQTPNHSKYPAQSRGDGGSRAPRESHGSSSTAQIKRETREESVSEAEPEPRLPGAYPRTQQTPIRNPPSHPSTFNQTPRILTKVTPLPTSINKASAPTPQTCTVCHELFVDVNAPCVSHSGRKMRQGDGSIVWECCGEDIDHPGCDFSGQHVTGEESEEDTHIRQKRPSALPGPNRSTQKRPRAF